MNKRGLEDHVEKDPSGEVITSQRKREHAWYLGGQTDHQAFGLIRQNNSWLGCLIVAKTDGQKSIDRKIKCNL